jgi:hypothetical protein
MKRETAIGRPSVLALALCAVIGAVLFLALKLNVWIDEGFTLETTRLSPAGAFSQALRVELQAPLYFVLLSLWRKLNDAVWFARLFSAACYVFTLPLVAALARRYLRNVQPILAMTIFALHPLAIQFAVEIRLYALLMLISGALLALFYDAYLAEQPQRRAEVLYVLVAVAALWTQYYIGLALLAGGVALLCLRRWRALARYLIAMMIVGGCFLPLARIALAQRAELTAGATSALPVFECLRFMAWRVQKLLLPVEWKRLAAAHSLILWLMALAGLRLWWKRKDRVFGPERLALLIMTAVITAGFVVILRLTNVELMQPRHTVALFLPLLLSALAMVDAVGRRAFTLTWLALVCCFSIWSLIVSWQPLAKAGDYQRVASFLMAQEKPGEPVLVFHGFGAMPLSYHYRGVNRIVPVPVENQLRSYNRRDYILRDEAQLRDLLRQAGDPERFWLVRNTLCREIDIDYNCPLLEAFVKRYYTVELRREFFLSEVRLLRRKPELALQRQGGN